MLGASTSVYREALHRFRHVHGGVQEAERQRQRRQQVGHAAERVRADQLAVADPDRPPVPPAHRGLRAAAAHAAPVDLARDGLADRTSGGRSASVRSPFAVGAGRRARFTRSFLERVTAFALDPLAEPRTRRIPKLTFHEA